jgi:hypothetical protein
MIYVLKEESGTWDSYHWWIAGLFTKKEDAEIHQLTLLTKATEIKLACPEYPGEDATEEQEDLYWNYHAKHGTYIDSYKVSIMEIPENQLLKQDY